MVNLPRDDDTVFIISNVSSNDLPASARAEPICKTHIDNSLK